MSVEIYIDLSKYSSVLADKLAQRISVELRNIARKFTAVDTGRLRNSIRAEGTGKGNYRVLADTPYAAAQEYGRHDLPKYSFTPYMRPAAIEVTSDKILNKCLRQAEEAAIMQSGKK